jgi:hypothetical protein
MIRRPLCLFAALLMLAGCTATNDTTPGPEPATTGNTAGPAPARRTIDPDPGPPPADGDGPHLVFTANGHDFGMQEKNTMTSHTAVFYNAGRAPLTIRQVKTHCGCAAALLSADTIAPGGRGTLEVTLNSGSLAGRREKTVEVFTNSPSHPVVKYPISCTVIADVALDPIVLVVRATRSAGEVRAHFDAVVMRPGFDLEIREVRTSDPDLVAAVSPLPEGAKQTGYRIDLTFGPSFDSRDFSEKVTVHTNSQRDPHLTLNVIGSVRQSVLVVPERLYYPRLRPGEPVTRNLYVYRDDGRPLTVTGIEDPSGMFETELTRQTPAKWEIRVTIAGESLARTVRGSLLITTDAEKGARVTVPYEVPGEVDEE